MTKNNLATHLKWLITQGKSLYLPPAPTSLPERDNHVSQQAISPTDEFATLDDILEVAEDETDVSMARLLPQSASKPRMLSRNDTVPISIPSTIKKRASPKKSSIARGM
jgi:bloom syndrome protein